MNALTKTLTEEQAREIALAVKGIEPNLELHDPADYDHKVIINQIEQTDSGGQLGIQVHFSLTSKSSQTSEVTLVDYRLDIGYWETLSNFNPGLMGLYGKYIDNREEVLEVEILCNMGVVVDSLRKYGVW